MPHQPTRLPYGLSFVKPGVASSAYTITNGDTTPDVSMGSFFVAPTSQTTITNFTNGERGKIIFVYSTTNLTTIQNSAGGINVFSTVATVSSSYLKYSSTGNYTMAANESMIFIHNGTDWSQVGASVRIP